MLEPVVQDSLEFALQSIEMIAERFAEIQAPDDFVQTPRGVMIMDSISMRLQSVGEKIKNIDQKHPGFLKGFGIDSQPIIRFRDFISHHYDEADYEVLYDVCKNHLPGLGAKIRHILTRKTPE